MTLYTLDTSDTHKYGEILIVSEGREDYITVGPKDGDEDKPNYEMAHLIAAAPDLYEALENVLSEISSVLEDEEYYFGTTKPFDAARSALAKSRGKA